MSEKYYLYAENAEDRYHNIRNIDFLVPTLAKPPNIWTSVPRVTIITNNVFSLSMQCLPIFFVAVHRGSPMGIWVTWNLPFGDRMTNCWTIHTVLFQTFEEEEIFPFHSFRTLIIRSQFFPGSGRIMATRFNGSLKDQISEEGRSLILLLVPYHPFHSPTHHITFPQLDYILHPQLGYNLQSTSFPLLSTPL